MILLIDNYDSFSYNLYQMVGVYHSDIKVIRNDEMTADQIRELKPQAIILSPGPGRPEAAGVCMEVVKKLGSESPILGVCLGHQAICEAYGATVSYAKALMHGKQSVAEIDTTQEIFNGLKNQISVARYHSLSVEEDTIPETLQVIAKSEDGEIMAVKHRIYPVYGLQFHPESILTPEGSIIIKNFLGGREDD